MAFNISDFNANLMDHGLARPNKFLFTIKTPSGIALEVTNEIPISLLRMQYYAKSVTLPEFDVQTSEVQPQGFGPIVRRPQTMNFPVLPVIFNVDSNLDIVRYFHRWTQEIINYDSSSVYGNHKGRLPFEMGYKSDYETTMSCQVFNEYGEKTYLYEFGGAYPVNVGNVETSWESNDEIMTLSVGFSYDRLKVTGSKRGDPSTLGDRNEVVNPFATSSKIKEITNDAEEKKEITEKEKTQEKILTRRGRRTRIGSEQNFD